jgi:DNA-directed RNA polymerase subunit RPC12/RpoP
MIAIDEIQLVSVCSKCGKGIPPWSPLLSMCIDTDPLWFVIQGTKGIREDTCNGKIMHVERSEQIRKVNNEYPGEPEPKPSNGAGY